MTDDVYVRLRKHLEDYVLGAPEADSIVDILRIRFTPEEAEVALSLGQAHEELSAIAEKAGRSEDELLPILERMADKTTVYKIPGTEDGKSNDVYALLPTAVGLWETSFATGERTPETKELARLWREYYKDGWGESMLGGVPFTRVIPVAKSISEHTEILPYEKASDLIRQYDYAVVIHCPCRESAELDGAGCGKPTEVCFHFGDLARFMASKGHGREVSVEEALEILDMTEKEGLVHMVGNAKEMGVAMCSCCTCCCTQLRTIKEFNVAPDKAMARSRFEAQLDAEKCVSCGVCENRCQFDAINNEDQHYSLNKERCVGCGLCVTTCPTGAITLAEREDYQAPVDTGLQLFEQWLQKPE